jgi:DNA-binding MarR family transcriptional regulator
LSPLANEDENDAAPIGQDDWARLAGLRAGIRRYLSWAEQRAREHGMTPAQVQLALAIRSHEDPRGPVLTELAETLLLRHHSVVGLVDRAERAELVRRERDPADPGRVHVVLTRVGAERLETLSRLHIAWLAEHGAAIGDVWRGFEAAAR